MNKILTYYKLTKPGIIRGNSLAVFAGFLLASAGTLDYSLLFWTLLGSALIIGGGCALNNFIDRDIDAYMSRTDSRALVSGELSPISALIFGSSITFIGFVVLYNFTNNLTVWVGLVGFIFYVFVYAYAKRKTRFSTLIGGVAGAIPPLAGYTAVSNELDTGALLVFLILFAWQIPHFYAIAIFRVKDYAKAGIPLMSLVKGIETTKKLIVLHIIFYSIVVVLPVYYNLLGVYYLVPVLVSSIYWLSFSISNYFQPDYTLWARKVFGNSLIVLIVFCFSILLDTVLI